MRFPLCSSPGCGWDYSVVCLGGLHSQVDFRSSFSAAAGILQSLESYFQVVTDLFSAKNRVNTETFGSISRVHHRSVVESEQARFRFGQFKTLANVVNGFSMFWCN